MDEWTKRFLLLLDEGLEDEATRPGGTVSPAALGIWRRTQRLYHLRGNPAVHTLLERLLDRARIQGLAAADEVYGILFGLSPGKKE